MSDQDNAGIENTVSKSELIETLRKEAAREIIEQLDKQQPYHENATYLFIRDYIIKTFGLDGVRDE